VLAADRQSLSATGGAGQTMTGRTPTGYPAGRRPHEPGS